MERRALGRTGVEVSALGMGCGAVGGLMVGGSRGEQVRGVARALEAGVTYFDTAPAYGDGASERHLGHCLRELEARDRAVVGTKVRLDASDLARPADAARRSLEGSLRRLGLDAVDLVHLHNPIGDDAADPQDPHVPARAALEEVAEGLRELVADGLARHIGFTAVGDGEALRRMAARPGYETAQAYLNVLNPSGVRPAASGGGQDFEGLVAHAEAHGTGVVAIRVYAAGALSAAPERHPLATLPGRPLVPGSNYGADLERARGLRGRAAELGLESVLELGLRFALAAPGVATALVGLSSLEHLESAIRWAERGPLPRDAFEALLRAADDRGSP